MEWHDIKVNRAGYRVVATALLSRGAMTAPRSLFVALPEVMGQEPVIVAEWNHQTGSYYRTSYHLGVDDAYNWYSARLMGDVEEYLGRGVPLTEYGVAD